MLPFLDAHWGNPSSVHQVGRLARSLLDDLRDRAAIMLGSKPSEIVFTSGGTEANNLAIFGTARRLRTKGRHLITSAIEHHSVLHCFEHLAKHEGFELTVLPVDGEGRVSPDSVRKAVRNDTILVSVMAANNEIGTVQPVAEIGAVCRANGVFFHTDAAQWFGKEFFCGIQLLNADLVTLCSHKFHGPKGAGMLFIRSPLQLFPIILGGGHENERRAGTENLPAVAGLVCAMEHFIKPPVFPREKLTGYSLKIIETLLKIEEVVPLATSSERLANTISFVVNGTDSFALLAGLDVEGICASAGSACSAGSLEPSHVVSALGLDRNLASSLVRFSLGRETTPFEVETVCQKLPEIIRRAKAG